MFKDQLKIEQKIECFIERNRKYNDDLEIIGKFHVEHYNKDGELIDKFDINNLATNEGKNYALDGMFHDVAPAGTWYIGLINASGFANVAPGDTLVSHAGWAESTTYTGNRLEWTEGAASAAAITNGTAVTFPITADGALKGLIVCSIATGTSGKLWSAATFSSSKTVNNGDSFKITYSVSL